MTYTISLPVFEGPLDLLLQLIERAELDITTIALAQVADQYLVYVRALDVVEPRALAEFIALAARLLLIKSRALLPRPKDTLRIADEGDNDAEALARQLREYQRFKQAAATLRAWQEDERRTFLRTAAPAYDPPPTPPLSHALADLIAAVQRRMQLLLPLDTHAPLTLLPRLTVNDVTMHVRARLARSRWISFDDVLAAAVTRQDLIVTFWAVLEMLKRRQVAIEQDTLFGTITIGRGMDYNDDE
ncbi:segregation/condensation protein A [Candidatus Gracilibacteria bacterium]|nr:segregation/condensation protein A [Candidatus Gracilibacteria bacterium]